MGKYQPLGNYLKSQRFEHLPMTFAEIEKILNFELPMSKRYPAWWSNNPSNNVMTRQWLDAGYETSSVDTLGEKLVFKRKTRTPRSGGRPHSPAPPAPKVGPKRTSIFGCMKGLFSVAKNFDASAPMELEPGWDNQYRPGP
jgi:hypothetical protein